MGKGFGTAFRAIINGMWTERPAIPSFVNSIRLKRDLNAWMLLQTRSVFAEEHNRCCAVKLYKHLTNRNPQNSVKFATQVQTEVWRDPAWPSRILNLSRYRVEFEDFWNLKISIRDTWCASFTWSIDSCIQLQFIVIGGPYCSRSCTWRDYTKFRLLRDIWCY